MQSAKAPDGFRGSADPTEGDERIAEERFGERFVMKMFAVFVAAAMLIMVMEGCTRFTDDGRTVGQKLDRVIERTNLALLEASDSFSAQEPSGSVFDAVANSVSDRAVVSALDIADAGISASIKSELVRDPALAGQRIGVESRDGIVSLSGQADDENTRRRAETVARAHKSVIGVRNGVTVGQP